MDPSRVMPSVLKKQKPLYVFSSHFHEDHFTKEIFKWRNLRQDLTYILSKDILRRRKANKEDADVWLAKGGTWRDERIAVWALGCTDSGVSWIVETEGRRIFHAGNLNNWYAKFLPCKRPQDDYLPDAVPGQKMYSFEMEEVFAPIAHEKQYLDEQKDILKAVIKRGTSELVQMSEREQARPKVKVADGFDVVMFPIDGRIGRSSSARLLPTGRKNGYTLGGRLFIERFKVGLFVPMHFTTGFESTWRFKEFTEEKHIPFWAISRERETVEI